MAHRFVINGKFLRAESTGVHRVATELCNALADLKAERNPSLVDMEFEVWHTRDGAMRAREIRLPCRSVNFLTGIPWEQLTLPLLKGRRTLLNFCNIGPVLSAEALTLIHDVQVHLSPTSYSRPFRLWYKLLQPILAKRNRRVLTVSEFSRYQIVQVALCDLAKIGIVHNGADHILRVQPDDRIVAALGLSGRNYVVALSTTQAHKNIGILLQAFALPQLQDFTLVLVGGAGPAAFVASGYAVPANACFAGRVSDNSLRALMETALCLAFPSRTEGFGLPPLEAMTLGCPTIVAPCGALPEVCGDATIYVAPDDASAWAAAIVELIATPDRRAGLVAAGRVQAAAFTWRNAALKLAAELTKAIGQR